MKRLAFFALAGVTLSGCRLVDRDGVDVGWEFRVHRPPVLVSRTPHILNAQCSNVGLTTFGSRPEAISASPPPMPSSFSAPAPPVIARSYAVPQPEFFAPPPRPITCEEMIELLRQTVAAQQRLLPPPRMPPATREEKCP